MKFHANVQYFFIHQYDTAIHHKDRDIQHKDTTVGTYTLLKRVCMNVVFYCLWFDKALLPETMKWTLQMQCKKA